MWISKEKFNEMVEQIKFRQSAYEVLYARFRQQDLLITSNCRELRNLEHQFNKFHDTVTLFVKTLGYEYVPEKTETKHEPAKFVKVKK